jgi:release factor glutamine methyltransferase
MTPRPATERLVERSLAHLGSQPATVADVGSGSGAIAIAVALGAPEAELWAADLSPEAVELAQANVALYGLTDRVHVVQGDLLDGVPGGLDLVVANLPYLPVSRRVELRYADLVSEPRHAVFAPGDGLGPYRRLLAASERRLAVDGTLLLQYRRGVFEAPRADLRDLLAELEYASALAA